MTGSEPGKILFRLEARRALVRFDSHLLVVSGMGTCGDSETKMVLIQTDSDETRRARTSRATGLISTITPTTTATTNLVPPPLRHKQSKFSVEAWSEGMAPRREANMTQFHYSALLSAHVSEYFRFLSLNVSMRSARASSFS